MFSKNNNSDNGEAVLVLIHQLEAKILKYTVQQKEDKGDCFEQFRRIVLIELLKYLKYDKNQKESPAKNLDLFCTANAIFTTIISAKNNLDYKEKITIFFRDREELLRGDSHDYCYSDSLANQLCYWLVRNTFPDANPFNILLQNAMTKDRIFPWQDPYTMENDLPKSAGDFFRTSSNQIHLYHGVIECAIYELKSGRRKRTDIWLATDRQPVEAKETSGGEQKENVGLALSADDLKILKQRAPAINHLVDYTELLEDSVSLLEKNIYSQFEELFKGLRDGATSARFAKPSSHIAIVAFCKWWCRLSRLAQQNIRGVNFELNAFVNQILTKDNYCTQMASRKLEKILRSESVRKAFCFIDKTVDPRISDRELDKRKERIFRELSGWYEITTKQDVFAELCHSGFFMRWCSNTQLFDYGVLKMLANLVPSRGMSWRIGLEKNAIVGEIFSLDDEHKLLALKDFLSFTQASKHKIFNFAVLVKLHAHHLLSPHEVKMLTKKASASFLDELLYYAVLNNKAREVICLLGLGADSLTSAYHFQHLFMDVGYECDVKGRMGRWYEARVVERKGNLVHVNYPGWKNIYNEWIDIFDSADRFAKSGTCSMGRPYVPIFPVIKNKRSLLFDVAFQNRQLGVALALSDVKNADTFAQQYTLLTAKTDEEWDFVLRYLNGLQHHFFQLSFLQDLLEHSIQHRRSDMIPVLARLGAKIRLKHIESVYRGSKCHLLTAKMVQAEPNLRQIVHALLFASQTKQQWDFARNYMAEFKKEEFDELFLQALMRRAVETFSNEMVKFLIDYGVSITSQALEIAFHCRFVEAIKMFLLVNQTLTNEAMLLSEIVQKNWMSVLAYIDVVVLSDSAFRHLVEAAIYQDEGSWPHLRYFLDVKKTPELIFNQNTVLDFKQKRQCAIEFFSYFIQKSTCPYQLVEMMNLISQMEEKNPLIVERVGHSSGIKGYQWNKKDVSHAWVELVGEAKGKIIDLARKNKQSFNKDDEVILDFLNKPTVRWKAAFYQSTSMREQYVHIKESWISEAKEELRPSLNSVSMSSSACF